jgi:AraC-like DNA-binding protein
MRPDEAPALAKLVGGYREMRPPRALAGHFRCAWSQALSPGAAAVIAVVPDGCVDIVWSEGRLSVAGPDVTAAVLALPPGDSVTGLRFRPGAASNWLGLPLAEITGRQLDLAEIWGMRAQDLAARIGDARAPAQALARLQAGLVGMAADAEPPAPDMVLAFRLLGAGVGIARLRDRLDISERSLRRRCHAAFGYGPKTLERILRFQRFLRAIRAAPGSDLAALAVTAGYADQAHLTREVRALSGFSPGAVARQFAGPAGRFVQDRPGQAVAERGA